MQYKYLFGPVLSRRLGISLGIDLTPYKFCNLNCLYCESGGTTRQLSKRDEYIPFSEVISELDQYLATAPNLDYVTFSGAGEPTLHSRIGEIINHIKKNYPAYKIALITNSILFSDHNLREEIKHCDLVMPSLDAVSPEVFKKINRPAKDIKIEAVINGLIQFRNIFQGQIWLEIFIVPGINDNNEELNLLKEKTILIKPDRIQLNSLDRPGTESWIKAAEPEELERIKSFFSPLPVEVISKNYRHFKIRQAGAEYSELVLSTIKRRPCTADEISSILALDPEDTRQLLSMMEKEGKIRKNIQNEQTYYQAL